MSCCSPFRNFDNGRAVVLTGPFLARIPCGIVYGETLSNIRVNCGCSRSGAWSVTPGSELAAQRRTGHQVRAQALTTYRVEVGIREAPTRGTRFRAARSVQRELAGVPQNLGGG